MTPAEQQREARSAQLQREVSTGDAAKTLADHPYLNRCLDELERAYIERWKTDTALTAAQRETLWNALQGAVAFRQHLRAQISSGEVARSHIEKMLRTGKPA
jgi:hypothetical protein